MAVKRKTTVGLVASIVAVGEGAEIGVRRKERQLLDSYNDISGDMIIVGSASKKRKGSAATPVTLLKEKRCLQRIIVEQRSRAQLVTLPQELSSRNHPADPVLHNGRCWILHPNYEGRVLGEARAGVSSASKCAAGGLSKLCSPENQMIQVCLVIHPNVALLVKEKRHKGKLKTLEDACAASSTYILWDTRCLV